MTPFFSRYRLHLFIALPLRLNPSAVGPDKVPSCIEGRGIWRREHGRGCKLRPNAGRTPLQSFAVLLLFLVCSLISAHSPCRAENRLSGTVVSVMDGDTLGIRTPNRAFVKVRLYGIDAPEHGQAYGNKAKKALSCLVFKKNVSIVVKDIDTYKRVVGIVWTQGRNINEQMIRKGYAWVYRWFCREPEKSRWLKLEKEAKTERIGLWAGKKPVPPWQWRRRKR